MKSGGFVEKRRFKRLSLSLPMEISCVSCDGTKEIRQGVTGNVSFNGAYIPGINIDNINIEDNLKISVTVPRDDARDFPFSRIAGKARVVRVEKDKDGIAFEFGEDISRLFVAT